MKEYIKILAVFNVAASIIFLFVHSPYNNSHNLGNNIENLYNIEIRSEIRFQRSLAKHVLKKELDHSKIREVISENNSYNNVKCNSNNLSEYAQLKKKGLNDLEIYKDQFKRKYAKRKGLKRLDCYCEKKIFDMIDRIGEQPTETSSYNIKLKKSIVRKWGIGTIVMCLIPLIGIIFPILALAKVDPTFLNSLSPLDTVIPYLSSAFFLTYSTIFILIIFYIFIKILKYERLEAGKGKLNFREYCTLSKDIFFA